MRENELIQRRFSIIRPLFPGLALLDGYIYAVGGWEGTSRLDTVERYEIDSNTWTLVASMRMAVTSPAVVAHEGKHSK